MARNPISSIDPTGRYQRIDENFVELYDGTVVARLDTANTWAVQQIFLGVVRLKSYTVATLPVGVAGDVAFATNVRVSGEGAGLGTGGIVSHNGTAWKVAGTNVTAVA